jgi:transcriptional regulator GlxA family with amidase domain
MSEYTIGIALYENVEELDFAGPYEVLTAWARGSEREISVRTVAETTEPVRCSHGLRVLPDVAWSDVGPLDPLSAPGR